jgi:DEAD/DEAH box helicase domain-containing protein
VQDHVVVDVEIQKTIEETPGGWDATDQLGLAVAVVFEHQTDRFRIYGPDDVPALRERLLKADRISSFNGWKFDYQVIWGLPQPQRVEQLRDKTNDILARIWYSLGINPDPIGPGAFTKAHGGWSLDNVMQGTFGLGKIGFGGDAPKWFQAGQWAKVANYCVDDVALERDLAVFVDRHGFVVNGKTGQVLRIAKENPLRPYA